MDIAYSGNFRHDGKLLTAGDEKGNIKLFDVETKTMLRQAQPHSSAVHAVDFFSTTQLLSGSDDKTICLYDIPTNMVINTYAGHTDYVRALSVVSTQSDFFLSGGFDGCVKLWDRRMSPSEACVLSLKTPHAVGSVLQLSASVVVAASEAELRVFDLLNSGKELATLTYHQKQITCLASYRSDSFPAPRFLSASLDGAVRVIDPTTFQVTHNFKFPDPVLAVAVSPANVMAVGTSAGILSTRVREQAEKTEETPALAPGALLARVVYRSKRVDPELEAKKVEITAGKRVRQSKWNRYLRKFEYKKALNAVLEGRNVRDIVAVLEELRTRGDLKTAIRGRTDKELEPLISFVSYYIVDPKYTDILTTVAEEILNHHGENIGQNSLTDSQLVKLEQILDEEIQVQKDVFSVMGMLEAITTNTPK